MVKSLRLKTILISKQAKVLYTFSGLLALASCNFDHPVDGLSGVWKTPTEKTYAVAYFTEGKTPSTKKNINLTLYRVLGSAKANPVHLSYHLASQKVEINFPEISDKTIDLKMETKERGRVCGQNKEHMITLCYGKDQVELTQTNPYDGNTQLEIKLYEGIQFKEPLNNNLTLDEALGRARFNNYKVIQEAEKVYRAAQKVKETRANLLPQFNAQTFAGMTTFLGGGISAGFTPFLAVSVIDNLMPFIYPTNWFKWQASKEASVAAQASYRSLQANQMATTETLFYTLQRDLLMIHNLKARVDQLNTAKSNVAVQSQFGLLDDAQVSFIHEKTRSFERQLATLQAMYDQELSVFAHSMAFNVLSNRPLNLVHEDLIEVEGLVPMDARQMSTLAKERAFELKALEHLKNSAHKNYKAENYSFLAPGSLIHFDAGYAAKNRTALSNEMEIQKQIDEAYSNIDQKSVEISSKFNSILEQYRIDQATLRQLYSQLERVQLPSYFKVERIQDTENLYDNIFVLQTKMLSSRYELLTTRAAYHRLTLTGLYSNIE